MRIGTFIVALAIAVGLPARANFHLWEMVELYSNADGSVQFLELAALASGQQFMAGHSLASTEPNGFRRTFSFPSNLPGGTLGRRMLIATRGFEELRIVTPDYVVPNNFFSVAGGVVNFANGADTWNHRPLPNDGRLSLMRDGSTAVNSPRNFLGQDGTIVPAAAAPNFQALWWKSPAGSESGWGVNITHQGDILFATWFTYDADGSGMWLVMSDGRKTAENTYTGALYRTTGPAFSAQPFNSAQVTVTQVGTATFTFSDADNGTFAYSVGGVSQSKAITRQVYSSPVATCSAGGAAGATPNYQDLWWRAPAGAESGWGVNITHQGDILFATWFTYGADGRGMWLVMSEGRKTGGTSYSGALYRTTGPAFSAQPWSSSGVTVTQAGTATFTFADASSGTFEYTVGGVTQTKPIIRQAYSTPATVCR